MLWSSFAPVCGLTDILCITPPAQTSGSQTFYETQQSAKIQQDTEDTVFSIMPQLISSTSEKW